MPTFGDISLLSERCRRSARYQIFSLQMLREQANHVIAISRKRHQALHIDDWSRSMSTSCVMTFISVEIADRAMLDLSGRVTAATRYFSGVMRLLTDDRPQPKMRQHA